MSSERSHPLGAEDGDRSQTQHWRQEQIQSTRREGSLDSLYSFIPSGSLCLSLILQDLSLSLQLSLRLTHIHRIQCWGFLRHSDWLRGDSDQPAPTQIFTAPLVNTNFMGSDPFQVKRNELQEEAEMKE